MNAAGVEELRLTFRCPDVVGDAGEQQLPAIGALPDGEYGADGGIIVLELEHHVEVGFIGGVEIPFIDRIDVHKRTHLRLVQQSRSHQDVKGDVEIPEHGEFLRIGIGEDPFRAHLIDGDHR